jgi:hypothetical protein
MSQHERGLPFSFQLLYIYLGTDNIQFVKIVMLDMNLEGLIVSLFTKIGYGQEWSNTTVYSTARDNVTCLSFE